MIERVTDIVVKPDGLEAFRARVSDLIALIDDLVSRQIDAVLHESAFQSLEASWRGIRDLVDRASAVPRKDVVIRVLNASWREVARDVRRSGDFEQTVLFQLLYDQEYGMPGGRPYGVVIGDYEVGLGDQAAQGLPDLDVLNTLGRVASASFAPFVCGAAPDLLGLQEFQDLERRPKLARNMASSEHARWRSLRKDPDARFLGLTAPRVLRRLPHRVGSVQVTLCRCPVCRTSLGRRLPLRCPGCQAELESRGCDVEHLGFRYRERVGTPGAGSYLWGNAAFAFGAVLIRSFGQSSWLGDIRGVSDDEDRGGVVLGLPSDCFDVDRPRLMRKPSTDVAIEDRQERELADVGIIGLSPCRMVPWSAFYSNPSVWEPGPRATTEERMAAMLQYTFCVSRFAHYLKVMARDVVGDKTTASAIQAELGDWINGFVTPDEQATSDIKARFPLRSARVRVRETSPGVFSLAADLRPHYELDNLSVAVRIETALDGVRSAS